MWGSEPQALTEKTIEPLELARGWDECVESFLRAKQGSALLERLKSAVRQGDTIYPSNPWRALALTPLDSTQVVIVGQDPYHQPQQANGLAFSVGPGQKRPPSLRNILDEVVRDCGRTCILDGQLEPWARQGVLLLNTVLTVQRDLPGSHRGWGWEQLSQSLLQAVDKLPHPVAFFLWGADAQRLASFVTAKHHRVWTANHPSPLAARRPPTPFVGCAHFSQANAWLRQAGQKGVEW